MISGWFMQDLLRFFSPHEDREEKMSEMLCISEHAQELSVLDKSYKRKHNT